MRPIYLAVASLLIPQSFAGTFTVTDSYQGADFINDWTFEAIADPTHGYVNYVTRSQAISEGLVSSSGGNFTLKADDTTVLSSSATGRNSVRIQSPNTYNSHVTVVNLAHMPKGCGTWPAIWEVGPNWPNGGEVDIVEGSNDIEPNQSTLHTSAGCTMPASRDMKGTAANNDCESGSGSNTGCGVKFSEDDSYGHDFNLIQGGFYAMERTTTEVKVWFWPRTSTSVPSDVWNGESIIDTDNWGEPQAYFPDTDCNFASYFNNNNIIINLTFCGDLAANTYASSGCPDTCQDFVQNNPDQLNNAYFLILWLKVYES